MRSEALNPANLAGLALGMVAQGVILNQKRNHLRLFFLAEERHILVRCSTPNLLVMFSNRGAQLPRLVFVEKVGFSNHIFLVL